MSKRPLMLSATRRLVSATVSMEYMAVSVTDACLVTGDFQAASPASAMVMRMIVTRTADSVSIAVIIPLATTVKGMPSFWINWDSR